MKFTEIKWSKSHGNTSKCVTWVDNGKKKWRESQIRGKIKCQTQSLFILVLQNTSISIFLHHYFLSNQIKSRFYKRSLTGTNQLQWWGWCHRLGVRQRSARSPLWPDQPEGYRPPRYLQQSLWCCIIKENINHAQKLHSVFLMNYLQYISK